MKTERVGFDHGPKCPIYLLRKKLRLPRLFIVTYLLNSAILNKSRRTGQMQIARTINSTVATERRTSTRYATHARSVLMGAEGTCSINADIKDISTGGIRVELCRGGQRLDKNVRYMVLLMGAGREDLSFELAYVAWQKVEAGRATAGLEFANKGKRR